MGDGAQLAASSAGCLTGLTCPRSPSRDTSLNLAELAAPLPSAAALTDPKALSLAGEVQKFCAAFLDEAQTQPINKQISEAKRLFDDLLLQSKKLIEQAADGAIDPLQAQEALSLLDRERQRIIDAFDLKYDLTYMAYSRSSGEADTDTAECLTLLPATVSQLRSERCCTAELLEDAALAHLSQVQAVAAESAVHASIELGKLGKIIRLMGSEADRIWLQIANETIDSKSGEAQLSIIQNTMSELPPQLITLKTQLHERADTDGVSICDAALQQLNSLSLDCAVKQAQYALARASFDATNVRTAYNMDGNLFEGTGLSAAEAGSLASQSSLLKLINYGQIVTADTVAFLASAQEQLGVIPQSNEVRNTVWICPDSSRALLCELQEKRKALESVAQAIESHFGSNDMRTGAQKKFLADLRSSLAQVEQALQSLAAAPEGVVQCHSHAAFSATFNREFQAHSETIELTALMTDRSARQTEMQEEGDPIKRSALAGELAMIDARIEILTIESERRALQRSRLILLAHKETGKVDQTEFSRSMLRLEAEIKQADDERGKAIKNELELKARNLTECVARTRSQITEESRKSMRRLILGEQAELPDDALSEADRAKLKDFQRIKDYGALVFQQLESVLANAESSPSTATALGDFEAASRGLARLSKMVDAYAVEHKVDLRSTEQASLLLRKAKTLAELFETRAKENELAAGLTSAIDQTVLESDTEPQAIKDTVHEHCELHCEFELGLARQQRALARLAKKAREELALIEKEYRELDPDDPQQAERCKVLENRISEKKKELEQLEAKSAALHHKHAQGSSKFTQELGQLDLHENTRRAVAQLAAVYDAQIAQYWGIFEQNNIEYTRSVDRLDTALMYRWTPDMSLYLFGKTMYTSTELGSPYYIIQNQPPAQSTPVFSSNHEYQIPVVQIQPPPLNEAIRILPFLATVFPSELTRRVEGQSKEKKERQENEHLVERIRRIEGREVWTDINGDIAAHERLNALRSDVLLSMEEKKKRDKHKITA